MKQQTISSRIKAETAMEIQFLKKELGINQTSIIESAIHHLYQETKQQKKSSRYKLFQKSGFIGGAVEAEPDLSVNYKKKFADYLSAKYEKKR